MNKIFKSLLFFLVVFTFGMTSCYEDKGDYDYRDLNSPVLDTAGLGLDKEIIVYYFKPVRLGEGLVKYNGDQKNLSYEWKIYLQNPPEPGTGEKYDSAKVLSREPVLDIIMYELPGKYYLLYTVTDKSNNDVKEYLRLDIKVESELSAGLCVLDKKNGKCDLGLIKTSRLITGITEPEQPVVYGIFSEVNPEVEVTDGKFLGRAYHAGKKADNFYFFTDNGGYTLDPNSYSIINSDFTSLFTFPGTIVPKPQRHIFTNRPMEIIVNNGCAYKRDYMSSDGAFGDQFKVSYGDGVAELAPFAHCLTTPNAAVFFDVKNHRYATTDQFGGSLDDVAETSSGAFNLRNVDKDLIYLEGGNSFYTNAIFKDRDATKYYLYIADFTKRTAIDGKEQPIGAPVALYSMENCSGITEQTNFVFGTKGDICYYSSGSDIYLYQYSLASNTSHSVYTFPGETITGMKLFTKSDHEQDGKVLMVATYKGTDDSGEGKIYLVNVNVVNGAINSVDEPYTGFGRIIDFIYKE